METMYDLGIIGAGVAGAFAAHRVIEKHPKIKSIIFDIGAKPGKRRRRQLEGWLGSLTTGDGKIYPGNLTSFLNVVDGRTGKAIHHWVWDVMSQANPMKIIKDSLPSQQLQKKIKEHGYAIKVNDYVQWRPDSIHTLSKVITEKIQDLDHLMYSFNNEVYSLSKKKNGFVIHSESGDYFCKKIIICVGRSGWRWVNKLYKDFGLISGDDYARFGVRAEISSQHMKEFNKSHCVLNKKDLTIGPFCWNGTVIPEDHADLVLSSFRSNEERWKTDKVSFSIISSRHFPNEGIYQSDRLAKLAFLLFNDRVSKEKIKVFLKNKSQLSLLKEYDWLISVFEELDSIIPNFTTKGYYYVPNIIPAASDIKVGKNLETEIDGMWVAGESAGLQGILSAAMSGAMAVEGAMK